MYGKIQQALKEIYWYDAKVYDIVSGGESISELSKKSQISYYSLYNTFRNVKEETERTNMRLGDKLEYIINIITFGKGKDIAQWIAIKLGYERLWM
ncbi:MAG: hypothetical protein CM15mV88_280 [Caudoviricetes sp.]|nr:MAG: hypothetical protein CM15mV88_280 [Caudoviricetes sp.]